MKKFFALALIVCALLMTGCGDDEIKKVGTIKYLNITETEVDNASPRNTAAHSNHKHVFFDNMNSMVAALQAGQIHEMSVYETVGNYLSSMNPNMKFEFSEPVATDNFSLALLEENQELKKEFNDAILKLTADGTLSKLVKTYISESNTVKTPEAVELPTFYGEPTIKIGVTGDLPLMDYIREDGLPAGFNTAVLAELSRRMEKNFVLVQIESGARAAALTSKLVDAVFWAVSPKLNGVLPTDFDTPEGVVLTKPYFSDEIVHVYLKDK